MKLFVFLLFISLSAYSYTFDSSGMNGSEGGIPNFNNGRNGSLISLTFYKPAKYAGKGQQDTPTTLKNQAFPVKICLFLTQNFLL